MSQRIRYAEVAPGILKSRRLFLTSSGQEVQVELDLQNKKYRILDSVTGAEVVSATGNTKNRSVLKIQAKRGLTQLGVSFIEEKRDRGNQSSGIDLRVGFGMGLDD